MKALVWHSRKNERAARRVLFKSNMAYYLLLLTGTMAAAILLYELTAGALRAIALAGILLCLIAMVGVFILRLLLDWQAAHDTRANKPALVEYQFGTKLITRTTVPLAEAGTRAPAPEACGVSEKIAYSEIRMLKEDGSYLYLFCSNRQPPLAIGLGTEGIEKIKKLLLARTGCGRIAKT